MDNLEFLIHLIRMSVIVKADMKQTLKPSLVLTSDVTIQRATSLSTKILPYCANWTALEAEIFLVEKKVRQQDVY